MYSQLREITFNLNLSVHKTGFRKYLCDNKLREQVAEENVLVLYWTKRYKDAGPITYHKLQVIKSTHCSYRTRLYSLASVSADFIPDKILCYCVWHFDHNKKYCGAVKSVLFHKDHNTVYNSQIWRHLLGVWLQYSLHFGRFLAEVGYDPEQNRTRRLSN